MRKSDIKLVYRDYISCLNRQDWPMLGRFVHNDVRHNGHRLGIAGYRRLLETDFAGIPDLHFTIELLVAEPPNVATRLRFNCTPRARFLNLDVNGRKVSFTENVFYEFLDRKIVQVWSVIDKAEIETQLIAHVDRGDD